MASISNSYKQGRCYLKGDGVEKDVKQAIRLFERSAEQGETLAQLQLLNIYYRGMYGIKKDAKKAIALKKCKWYTNFICNNVIIMRMVIVFD